MATFEFKITNTATECREAIAELLEAAISEDSRVKEFLHGRDVQQMQERYDQWAGNLGALQHFTSSLSLEHRIQDAPLVRESILNTLEHLLVSTQAATDITTGICPNRTINPLGDTLSTDVSDYDISSESDTSSVRSSGSGKNALVPSSEIQQLISAIRTGLDSLFKTSTFVRKFAPKGKCLMEKSPNSQVDTVYISSRYPLLVLKNPSLATRLSEANARRRHYFNERLSTLFAGEYGGNLLQAAAGGGYLTVVERLLQKKSDVNAPAGERGRRTALQAAAEGGHLAVVERLLQQKADVNSAAAKYGGRTALQAAAEGGHLAVVERLLQQKADVNSAAAEYGGRTALQAAAGGGHLAVVETLLQQKADVNSALAKYGGRTALQAAAEGGHLAVVETLLQHKADVNAAANEDYNGRTALQAAAEGGHLAVVETLLQQNANVNAAAAGYDGRTALQAAAGGGHLTVVETLLQQNANVNAAAAARGCGRTALQAAAEGGHLAVVKALLQQKADVNSAASTYGGTTVLQAAGGGGPLAVVKTLLQQEADVNASVAQIGYIPLHQAASDHPVANERLLQQTEDLNATLAKWTTYDTDPAASAPTLALYERAPTTSAVSFTRSYAATSDEEPPFPPLPSEAQNGTPFLCPYCLTSLQLNGECLESQWKEHVIEDLEPYICTFSSCGLDSFQSQQAWFEHELHVHRSRWFCSQCFISFQSSDDIKAHINRDHGDLISDRQLSMIIDQSKRPVDSIQLNECPFCDSLLTEANSSLMIGKEVPAVDLDRFQRHLGQHLQEAALFALDDSFLDSSGLGSDDFGGHLDHKAVSKGSPWGRVNEGPEIQIPSDSKALNKDSYKGAKASKSVGGKRSTFARFFE